MSYREFKISNYLVKYLYSIISITAEKKFQKIVINPDGCDYIMFSSLQYHGLIKKSKEPIEIELDNEHIYLLRLKPYTLNFLNYSHDNFLEKINELQKDIYTTKSILKIMSMVYYYLFEDVDVQFSEKMLVEREIVDLVVNVKGDVSVLDIENHFGINIRTIQRKFSKNIGLTPKEFIDIIRLQSDIIKINFLKPSKSRIIPSWYKDYSHYFKFFKKYTNLSPKDFFTSGQNRVNSIYDIY